MERTEALIAREEARAWAAHRSLQASASTGKRVLLITGGVKSWSVVSALQEVGMEIVGTCVKKSTKEDKERIKEIMGDGRAHDRRHDAARDVQDAQGRAAPTSCSRAGAPSSSR